METRNHKLSLARKKLKDHQDKKSSSGSVTVQPKDDCNITKAEDTHAPVTSLVPINPLNEYTTNINTNHTETIPEDNFSKQLISNLEAEIVMLKNYISQLATTLSTKDTEIAECKSAANNILSERDNLMDQLELTTSILQNKEHEIQAFKNKTNSLENQLESCMLNLQQVTNGIEEEKRNSNNNNNENVKNLLQKVSILEHQLETAQKERNQSRFHYEQYVNDLNEQLKSVISRNEKLSFDVQNLSSRESALIEQLSNMEVRMQSLKGCPQENICLEESSNTKVQEMEQLLTSKDEKLSSLEADLLLEKQKIVEYQSKIQELQEKLTSKCDHENISITKLNADMTSDKIAAQKATEQNIQLKQDIIELEEAYVKMSQDKLELTEKVEAEKFLNKELTLKLADTEDMFKEINVKLQAKDKEMMRLQTECRELEKQLLAVHKHNEDDTVEKDVEHDHSCEHHDHLCEHSDNRKEISQMKQAIVTESNVVDKDAMVKLQERFLKIMEEVADLSDEKHRLEHIIGQLQNETEIICEYVALYQQQRSLLKIKDAERSKQLKIFQNECETLKNELNELSEIILKLTEDKELSKYFDSNLKRKDVDRLLALLATLKHNSIVNSGGQCTALTNFHPCACCSGKLINV